MPGDSGVLVVTRVRSTTTIAHEAAGATGARHSPRPPWGERFINGSGAMRREREVVCGLDVIASEVTQTPSFRDGPQDQTRNLEIPGSMRSLSSGRASRGPVGIAPE